MRAPYDTTARKRPVNLTLNEDLVKQARDVTNNLSGVVESLLSNFLLEERRRRLVEGKAVKQTIAAWNSFGEQHGSFADEHSTL